MFKRLLLLLFILVLFNLKGQHKLNFTFSHLESSSGFPAKLVRGIAKGKSDFLWMLTDKGLMKYNGHTGKFYGPSKDSSNKYLLPAQPFTIYVDKTGIVWIGYVDVCLSSFDPKTETFTHYYHDPKDDSSFPAGGAVKFIEDSKGNFWIAAWGGGLTRFDRRTKKFKTYKPNKDDPRSISTHNTTEIVELNDGKFLIGSWEGEGLQNFMEYFDPAKQEFTKIDLESYKFESENEKGAINQGLRIIHFIYPEGKGITWVGSFVGLIRIDENNKTMKRISGSAKKNGVFEKAPENSLAYVVDNSGKIWVSTEVTGIMVVDPITLKCGYINHSYKDAGSISADNIFSMYKDDEENIWVCTNGGGIDVYTPILQQFKFVENERLEAERIDRAQGQSAITKLLLSNNSDDVYLCHGNGVTVYNPKSDSIWRIDTKKLFTKYKGQFGIKEFGDWTKNVRFIHEFGEKLVLCNMEGLIIYNKKTQKCTFPYFTDFVFNDLNKNKHSIVAVTRKKTAKDWDARLVKMDTNFRITKELHYPEWPFKDMAGVYHAGYVQPLGEHQWFIYFNNLLFYIFNDETDEFKTYCYRKPFANFPDSLIVPLTKDKDDMMWLRASEGIWRFDYRTGKAECYTEKFKIGKDLINNLTIDKEGNFWLATKQDLIRYEPKTGETFRFYQKLGLRSRGFAQVTTDINNRDEMFVPSSYGLLHFDPHSLQISKKRPDILISNITINKDTLDQESLLNFLHSDHTLAYNQNYLTFEYFTAQLYSPGPRSYQYRLLGLDSTWYSNENRNYISYPGLAPGNYTLELKCKNVYSVKSNLFQLSFTIEKPFWKRWWFIVSEILILLISVMFVVKRREKKLQADKLKLENTVAERTKEVVEKAKEIELQNHIIFQKNKEMTDSINYAERIQRSFLASQHHLINNLKEYFILFKPKAIVSGDFYWSATLNNGNFALITADSTGHGVPGAIMSLLNITSLEKAIETFTEPSDILNATRDTIIARLKKDGSLEGGKDGMDCSLCVYDFKNMKLYISAAHNPVWIIRNSQVIEIKADKMPVGKHDKQETSFTQHEIDLQKGDLVYTITDGFSDQFGGPLGKKYMSKNLRELLLKKAHLDLNEQKQQLENIFNEWIGELEQIDDVTVIGVRV